MSRAVDSEEGHHWSGKIYQGDRIASFVCLSSFWYFVNETYTVLILWIFFKNTCVLLGNLIARTGSHMVATFRQGGFLQGYT